MTPYPHYKPSHITWLGDIPEHWVEKRFKDITQIIQDGTHFTPTYTDQGINFLSVNDITRIPFDLSKSKYISVNEHNELIKRCRPQRGDILLSKNGTIGVPFLIDFDEEISIYVSLCLIRLKKQVDKKYFLFILLSDFMFEQYRINAKTNSVSNLHLDKLANFYTILPPLSEQAAIATYLDRKTQAIDKKIELLNQKITHYQHLRKTLINETVCRGLDKNVPLKDSGISWIGKIPQHWEVRRLKNNFSFGKGLTITKENLKEDGIHCVNYGEIHSKYGFEVNPEIHPLKCVDIDYLKSNSNSLLKDGDFVFADTSEDIEGSGNFTFLNSKVRVFAGYHTIIARPNSSIYSKFLAYQLDSLTFRSQIKSKVKGVKVYSITQTILKELIIWIPPLPEQTAIAQYLDQQTQQIDYIVKNLQKQIELLRELRKTLINEVVTGKVRVVDL